MHRQARLFEIRKSFAVAVADVDDYGPAGDRGFEQFQTGRDDLGRGRIEIFTIGMQERILHVDEDESGLCHCVLFRLRSCVMTRATSTMR